MNLKGLRAQLREQPFHPFRIVTSDGESHEVRHPELVIIVEGGLVYLFEASDSENAEAKMPKKISAMHITTLEPVEVKNEGSTG